MVDSQTNHDANLSKVLCFLFIKKNLHSNYKYERKNKRYAATQRKMKVGTELFTQLLKGNWKLAKTTLRRDKKKAPEITQNIFEAKIYHNIALLKTV